MTHRRTDLDDFYDLLQGLGDRVGGPRRLRDCSGQMTWPQKGLYFFFEEGELRENEETPRVVRVGTHALSETSRTTLWRRLAQHRGTPGGSLPGGGNHRGSIFRLHVGTALLARDGMDKAISLTWGDKSSASLATRQAEYLLEREVSSYIGNMPFLWLSVPGAGGPGNDRDFLERNSIALLSNFERPPVDPPSSGWLGMQASRPAIRLSGLWNVNHVEKVHVPDFLDRLAKAIHEH